MIEVPEDWFSLTTKTWWYLGIVLVSRQLMIWQFYNPWEKLPVALMILLQVLLVERVSTRDVGLGDWNRWNVALAMIVVGIDLALVNLGGFGLNLVLLGPDAINNLVIDYPGQLYLASFPYQFLAVAFAEELLFRGYLYTKLRIKTRQAGRGDRWSMVTSVLVTSVLFGLFHVPWYLRPVSPGDGFGFYLPADLVLPCIRRVVSTGLFGVLMAFLYEKTGSILAPMIIHGASNSIQPLLTFSGGAGPGDTLAGIVIPWSGTILVAAHLMLVIAIWKPLARRWKWMLAARKPWSDDGRVQPREP